MQDDVADPALGEVLDFMRGIWALDHAVQRTSKRMERELGITGLQRLVIRVVGRFPSIPAGHLAELLHVHPSTLTGVLGRLERQGALRRRTDPRDKRRSLLGLTEQGRKLDVETQGTIEAAIKQVLERTDPRTIEAARSVLHDIVVCSETLALTSNDAKRSKSDACAKSETVRSGLGC